MATTALLKGSKLISFINDPEEERDEQVMRAKALSILDLQHIEKLVPQHVIIFPHLTPAADQAWKERAVFLSRLASPVQTEAITRLLPPEGDNALIPQVVVSGSSRQPHSPEREQLMRGLETNTIPAYDTVRSNWTLAAYEEEELPTKDKSLINTVIITDKTSYGAVKDVGLAAFRAIAFGSYAIISFPPDTQNPQGDYARARALAMSHFNRLCKEFPWIKHHVRFASSIAEVGQYCKALIPQQQS